MSAFTILDNSVRGPYKNLKFEIFIELNFYIKTNIKLKCLSFKSWKFASTFKSKDT